MRPKLTIVDHYDDTPEPSRAEVAAAAIEQNHLEYRSPERDVSNPTGWHPYTHPAVRAKVLDVGTATYRATRFAVVDNPIPLWRRLLRRLRGEL